MGLFGKIFGKPEAKTEPKKEAVQEKPKAVIKEQRHILENIDAHMKTIMEYAEKSDDSRGNDRNNQTRKPRESEQTYQKRKYKKCSCGSVRRKL